jgi:preprotein translocase subunit SecG
MSIVIWILTFLLVITSLFLVLIVLAQKAKSDGGMGSAIGGGAAEAAFGAETNTVLSKSTIYASIAFFVLSLVLYLARLNQSHHGVAGSALPTIPVSTAPVLPPAGAPAPAAPAPGVAVPAPAAPSAATPAPAAPAATTTPAPATAPAAKP